MRHATPMLTTQRYVQAQLERRQGPLSVSLTSLGVPEECPATCREKQDCPVSPLYFNELQELEGVEAAAVEPDAIVPSGPPILFIRQ